ncbi:MAG TPA: VOC family protein [Stellaceae bacterium]|nr:VOC family protein [Stellaceae bacterium]
MPLPLPVLDHVVIDVRDRMDEAARAFAALGFRLTPRGHHTLGSMNHLAMFATDYLELLGFGDGGTMRSELARFPVGLNGLVFKTANADDVYADAAAAGLPVLPVQRFSRPVDFHGERRDATFRTTRLDPAKITMGRVYFCEHLTPDLVWRSEWQAHPNGAEAIARVVVTTAEPRRGAALFAALFGAGALSERDGACILATDAARVELMPPAAIAAEFGDAAAAPAGRSDYLAVLELRVASLEAAAERLRAVASVRVEARRIVVPAAAACNTTLSFVAAQPRPAR